jgi:probable phosphomutase (TIGR03848 family)
MTRPTHILLVRHAHSTANLKSILAGQDRSVALSERGRSEAALLASHLSDQHNNGLRVSKVGTSPLLRARETIAPFLAEHPSVASVRESGIIEMDYGSWSGKKIALLAKRPLWREIQRNPSMVRFPDGESFLEMASRSSEAVRDHATPGKTTLFVSHGDVIKSIVATFLGLHLDQFQRIVIEPASITSVTINNGSPMINFLNSTSHLNNHSSRGVDSTLGGGSGAHERKSVRGKRS